MMRENEQEDTQPRVGLVIGSLLVVMLPASLDQTIVGELGGLDHISWVVTSSLLPRVVRECRRISPLCAAASTRRSKAPRPV